MKIPESEKENIFNDLFAKNMFHQQNNSFTLGLKKKIEKFLKYIVSTS